MLIEKFREFARETTTIGTERVASTNAVCDQLIGTGHSDAAVIAEWKDQINESWAGLLELIETRKKVNGTSFTHNTCAHARARTHTHTHTHTPITIAYMHVHVVGALMNLRFKVSFALIV